MENLHVLPTNKPSRLFKDELGKFHTIEIMISKMCFFNNQNIYITSDEEIKEGEYAVLGGSILSYHQMHKKWGMPQGLKIILTTDQDLIKDGVQAIDYEFLEWFVKNPSCDSVEVEKGCILYDFKYKIIIPKKEPFKHEFRVLSKEEVMEGRSSAYEFIDFDKQKTLEEVSLRLAQMLGTKDSFKYIKSAFELGAKWQQEQDKNKYSELAKLRNELYEQLPTGKSNAFDLIKIINNHINRIDELI